MVSLSRLFGTGQDEERLIGEWLDIRPLRGKRSIRLRRGISPSALYLWSATASLLAKTSHHTIISAFGELIVKPGHLEPKFHKYIIEAFTLRNDCDYLAPFEAEKSQAAATLQRATEFVEAYRESCQ